MPIWKKINNKWVEAIAIDQVREGGSVKNIYKKVDGRWHPIWDHKWVPDPWSPCSVPCNGGVQYREVRCNRNNNIVPDKFCADLVKPITEQVCNTHSCTLPFCTASGSWEAPKGSGTYTVPYGLRWKSHDGGQNSPTLLVPTPILDRPTAPGTYYVAITGCMAHNNNRVRYTRMHDPNLGLYVGLESGYSIQNFSAGTITQVVDWNPWNRGYGIQWERTMYMSQSLIDIYNTPWVYLQFLLGENKNNSDEQGCPGAYRFIRLGD